MLTSFTRIVITFSLARQALGSPSVPPNQVIVGISLLLSFVVMAPTFSKINDAALQPLLDDKITISEAIDRAEDPMRAFLLKNTRDSELSSMRKIAGENPDSAVSTTGFVPLATAFVLSELRTAFTIGFLIYIPFLIIDLVVASILMSLGLMFLPPSFVSLPVKLLLFILLGGWTLIAETVVRSFA
jgi:flagellar biosynthetic protein FliP